MKPVSAKFDHWLPKALKMGAITLGHSIYFSYPRHDITRYLFAHEIVHVEQVERIGNVFMFLAVYLGQWIFFGFSYEKIPLEIEAYGRQDDHMSPDGEREYLRLVAT